MTQRTDMPQTRRIAVARIWHEANSFNPLPTTLEDFRRREWTRGPEALAAARGTATELGGLARFLEGRPDWEVTVSRCTSAPPGGLVAREARQAIVNEILDDLRAEAWDGVYISLHGAMVAEDDLAPDASFLARVREAVGPAPLIAVSLDMHACIDPAIAGAVDILSGYHTYPHVDMDETALRCLGMMDAALRSGRRPGVTLRAVPFLPLSHGMRTASGPMRDLVAMAEAEQAAGGYGDVSVFGGFAYADTPHAHATVAITHDATADAGAAADRLADAVLARRGDFAITLPDARAALQTAADLISEGRTPVAIVDTADNPLSGGIGDTTELFARMLAMAPPWPSVFCFFHDPALVARAHELGVSQPISCDLGGRIAPGYGAPVRFDGVVERLTDGRFVNRGPMERGREIHLGRTAVLRAGQVRVVIGETCQSANDPAWCDLHGIDLQATALFCVKAKNHFRAAFEQAFDTIIDTDCPGPAPLDLTRLPFHHVPRSYLEAAGA